MRLAIVGGAESSVQDGGESEHDCQCGKPHLRQLFGMKHQVAFEDHFQVSARAQHHVLIA